MTQLRLGLVGDRIHSSAAPLLHRLAGHVHGLDVSYERLIPAELGLTLEELFAYCREQDFHGVNVTHPYKEQVLALVDVPDPDVRAIGAVNTVLFEPGGPQGSNTDHSGFVAAYCGAFGISPPGRVCLVGAGGVGRAIAFALARLGARELALCDLAEAKAQALAEALSAMYPGVRTRTGSEAAGLTDDVNGIVNCTPVGLDGIGGSPVAAAAMPAGGWAFDVVYTPADTAFLRDARRAGLVTVGGFELFFHQSLHAFERFAGIRLDETLFRTELEAALAETTA